ncbi:MAG: hypothetical protein QOE61_152 [Micromonosporaceae bacterium]|nr:hypothetical protein [Micromonosporaceae bacterium]
MGEGKSVRVYIDAWHPSYGTGMATGEDGPTEQASADITLDVERSPADWQPLAPPPHVRAPDVVLLVDGVRRIDARLSFQEADGTIHAGIAASYAAGVVRCDLRQGRADVTVAKVERGIFTPSPNATGMSAGNTHYGVHRVAAADPSQLLPEVQKPLAGLETEMAIAARANQPATDDLLVLDGPLSQRSGLPRALGYIKTHHKLYLQPEQEAVVRRLQPGQRCPLFQLGNNWPTYTWYLKLPGPAGSPWAGVVRVETSARTPLDQAIRMADLSAITLPRFASIAYKDPRAPQNLTAIGGLERRLHHMLGDQGLLVRALTTSATTFAPRGMSELVE